MLNFITAVMTLANCCALENWNVVKYPHIESVTVVTALAPVGFMKAPAEKKIEQMFETAKSHMNVM